MNILILTLACLSIAGYQPVNGVEMKVDCHPLNGATKETCESVGCIWSPVEESAEVSRGPDFTWSSLIEDVPPRAEIREPWCYFPSNFSAYEIRTEDFSQNFEMTRRKPSSVPMDVLRLKGYARQYDKVMRLKIYDPNQSRFEPEIPKLNLTTWGLDINFSLEPNGELNIGRAGEDDNFVSSNLQTLIYTKDFIQINFNLASSYVFGLGEHYDNFLKKTDSYKAYSFYNTDKLPLPQGRRSYGSFPFLINLSKSTKTAYGIYFHNSDGMDIVLQPDNSISFRTVGGVIDLFFFSGPTALDVIKQYQNLVGLPDLPPQWSLGFHLCRYNYSSIENLYEVWNRTRHSGIPFDVQWTDIDYMHHYNDFTYDEINFPALPNFVDMLHTLNMHYVPIFDPGLSAEPNYEPYKLGLEMNAFIKNASGEVLVGRVWNKSNRTVFPDFSNPNATELWKILFKKFHDEIAFDGAWIDMNEISNFVDGSLDGCPAHDESLYKPGGYDLKTKTLCPSARHYNASEYDIHNLYSFYEAIATYEALKEARPGRRPFIISRASSPGQGHYGGHWSGDVLSTWDYLRWSIVSSIEHSMYGFNMMGSDICGFVGDTNPELCARWSTLGAFYTFSRNHNDEKSIPQDPVALGEDVLEANRNALTMRYSLLPYLYTLIHRAHIFGEPVVRSTGLQFHASDLKALDAEYQFMWGKDMIISPVVHKGSTSKRTYLPKGRWFEINVQPKAKGEIRVPKLIEHGGEWFDTSNISLRDIPIFFRAGCIIPVYREVKQTVTETVRQPIGLDIMNTAFHGAFGELYLDDGESLDGLSNHLTMKLHNNNTLDIVMRDDGYTETTNFSTVNIFPMRSKVLAIVANGKEIPFKQRGYDYVTFDLTGIPVLKENPLKVEIKTE